MSDKIRKKIYWRRVPLFKLVEKIKLWPSRRGVLHGIKTFKMRSDSYAYVVTHCNEQMVIRNSKNSRAARWLRNKWYFMTCERCAIPEWKIKKYSATVFKRRRLPAFLDRQEEKIQEVGSKD